MSRGPDGRKFADRLRNLRDLVVHLWPIDKLLPYARNARTHSDEQVAKVAASIVEFGWTNPILVGADGTITTAWRPPRSSAWVWRARPCMSR